MRFTGAARVRRSRLFRLTVQRSPRRFSKASYSVTRGARSPEPTACGKDCSKRPTRARCFSMAGEMSAATQAKLLRVLTDGKILRVGSTKPRDVDVRVIVATHRNLEERARRGEFRQDLCYRLAVVPIALPSLRARRDDIPGLCEVLCREVARDLKAPVRRISPRAIQKISRYDFPGNIRELRNLIERAMILSTGPELGPDDFPVALAAMSPAGDNGNREHMSFIPEPVNLRSSWKDWRKSLLCGRSSPRAACRPRPPGG